MSKKGLVCLTSCSARSRFACMLKSHGLPSCGSTCVRSRENPDWSPMSAAAAQTRGGEYISDTCGFFVCPSFMYSMAMFARSPISTSSDGASGAGAATIGGVETSMSGLKYGSS